jgi:cellulose synthase/poly-beta-1,6-N-acetylglucosamine synthase-like glycosyltransferase
VITAIFFVSLLLGAYPYAIYPLLAAGAAQLFARQVKRDDRFRLSVTVVISAYNEAVHIRETVLNKIRQDYPADLLEVLVVSDGSDDGTDRIVADICAKEKRVSLVRQEPRAGKTSALNLAMDRIHSDLVVFSDANSIYREDTIRQLVSNFADADVGYVTGSMRYVTPDGSLVGDGCSAYMRYENWLRVAETQIGSIVGVDGGVDAVRRGLFQKMRADQLPDFVLPLSVVMQGRRVVYDPAAILTEDALASDSSEFRMRARVALRAFWALLDLRKMLNPFRFGVYSLQLISHKLLRYMSFMPMGIALLTSSMLAVHHIGHRVFMGAVACALVGSQIPVLCRRVAVFRYMGYFALVNIACAVAFLRFVSGKKQVVWKPREG